MRILVTGSREFTDYHIVHDALLEAAGPHESVTVVHGDCPTGADVIADYWARFFDLMEPEPHPADWEAPCRETCKPGHRRANDTCPAQGHYRNQEMVDLGADVCLAFCAHGAGNRGTKDCANRALKAGGIPVHIIWDSGPCTQFNEDACIECGADFASSQN